MRYDWMTIFIDGEEAERLGLTEEDIQESILDSDVVCAVQWPLMVEAGKPIQVLLAVVCGTVQRAASDLFELPYVLAWR